jgi:hypothetical protein
VKFCSEENEISMRERTEYSFANWEGNPAKISFTRRGENLFKRNIRFACKSHKKKIHDHYEEMDKWSEEDRMVI